MKKIKEEEDNYVEIPVSYDFGKPEERERILYQNFVQVGEDVKCMIKEVLMYKVK